MNNLHSLSKSPFEPCLIGEVSSPLMSEPKKSVAHSNRFSSFSPTNVAEITPTDKKQQNIMQK